MLLEAKLDGGNLWYVNCGASGKNINKYHVIYQIYQVFYVYSYNALKKT